MGVGCQPDSVQLFVYSVARPPPTQNCVLRLPFKLIKKCKLERTTNKNNFKRHNKALSNSQKKNKM